MKRIVAALFAVALLGGQASAEDYPSRAIKLVLPQPAGGAVDLIARAPAGAAQL